MRISVSIVLALVLGAACTSAPAREPGQPSLEPPSSVTASTDGTSGSTSGPTGTAPDPAPDSAPDPQPVRSRFAGRMSPIPASLAARMRETTWHPGCPVPLQGLSLLRFNYVGFDGEIKRGPMVVNASVARDLLWVFEQLFDAGFPIKRLGLAREFDLALWEEASPHTQRSVTASFNCRVVITPDGPGQDFSQHSYGLAVDLNPLQNPFVRADGWVDNRFARPYVDRSGDLPGMVHEGDVVVRSFAVIGWAWGGRWSGDRDYMHFSLLGR